MIERIYAADSEDASTERGGYNLVAGDGIAGSERSETGASRWIELESSLDVGRNYFGAACG